MSVLHAPQKAARRARLPGGRAFLTSFARRAVFARLQGITDGSVAIVDAEGLAVFGQGAPRATIRVHDPRFYRRIALGGHLGAAESYMDGMWTCDDLASLVRVLVRNRAVLESMEGGFARVLQPLRRAWHFLNRNSHSGSRRNIAAHYDLGNDFFELFLDPSLMYSCALFEREDMTLEQAQFAKNESICEQLELKPTDRVLEIGTGWGGFAIHAAQRYGCRVTTATISKEQFDKAVERVRAAGLEERVDVLLRDYRELVGTYDKIVSIEMIEAVGHEYYDTFFRQCSERLAPHGRMLLQAIVITDKYYESARREVDFIKRYIFPGSCIPSVSVLTSAAARMTDMRLAGLRDLTADYAETLRRWRANFEGNRDRIRALGYPEEFLRMWEFYFCYCEGGFDERYIGDVHMLFTKPRA